MTSTFSLTFSSPPSPWGLYPRILLARKPARVAEGRQVPRIEARLSKVRVDSAHLRRYQELCGEGAAGALPLAYPHLLASGLHLAMLASDRFPVALLGLVHVANRIESFGVLDPGAGGELACWIEGHEETPRGQQFALHTEWTAGTGNLLWRECCTFLARAKRPAKDASGQARDGNAAAAAGANVAAAATAAAAMAEAAEARAETPKSTTSFRAPVGLGRRYGQVSGDINPIHIADVTARAFGFRAAIAHGMWSMARCAAEIDSAVPSDRPRVLDVQFRLPVFLPSWLSLQYGRQDDAVRFELRDSQGEKVHLAGSFSSPA